MAMAGTAALRCCGATIASAHVELRRYRPGSRKSRPVVQGTPAHLGRGKKVRAPGPRKKGDAFWLPERGYTDRKAGRAKAARLNALLRQAA